MIFHDGGERESPPYLLLLNLVEKLARLAAVCMPFRLLPPPLS